MKLSFFGLRAKQSSVPLPETGASRPGKPGRRRKGILTLIVPLKLIRELFDDATAEQIGESQNVDMDFVVIAHVRSIVSMKPV